MSSIGLAFAPISGYAILRELGQGGMSAVYLARHQATGDEVALKVM
jgi:serine/threonine protein kinase